MASNQASMARRQREIKRQQKRREKLALKQARREEKARNAAAQTSDDPMDDPTVDWGEAVREVELEPDEFELAADGVRPREDED